ncbi:hypothetical protein PPACK8108_LOCUS23407 [Phakopsora pachyrhizi]|uniref:Uncharacterized protein n=1 Tax=Phakopsora pachyrhizi TaxID=170000 RepID=A0AAV0BQ18_PHAPC|nr:hypothetical protein PPACK8108_LOCUS23407 [Phakopsora pachyrhizi]
MTQGRGPTKHLILGNPVLTNEYGSNYLIDLISSQIRNDYWKETYATFQSISKYHSTTLNKTIESKLIHICDNRRAARLFVLRGSLDFEVTGLKTTPQSHYLVKFQNNGGLEGSSYQAELLLEAFKSFQTEQPWDFERIHSSDHGLIRWSRLRENLIRQPRECTERQIIIRKGSVLIQTLKEPPRGIKAEITLNLINRTIGDTIGDMLLDTRSCLTEAGSKMSGALLDLGDQVSKGLKIEVEGLIKKTGAYRHGGLDQCLEDETD